MKKFLFVCFALFCVNGIMAQGVLRPKDKTPVVAHADKETGIIIITVPKGMRVEDNIFVENASIRDIVQMSVMVDYNRDDKYVTLFNASAIPVGITKVVAESDEAYGAIRGKTLKMKIKGRKPNTEEDSYDFNVSLYEHKHDLYIKVGSNDDSFDF